MKQELSEFMQGEGYANTANSGGAKYKKKNQPAAAAVKDGVEGGGEKEQ
jgi:hypothetical protein